VESLGELEIHVCQVGSGVLRVAHRVGVLGRDGGGVVNEWRCSAAERGKWEVYSY